jgi:hypothetical protein
MIFRRTDEETILQNQISGKNKRTARQIKFFYQEVFINSTNNFILLGTTILFYHKN